MYHETTKNWGGSSEYDEQHKHKHAKEGEALNSNTIQKSLEQQHYSEFFEMDDTHLGARFHKHQLSTALS